MMKINPRCDAEGCHDADLLDRMTRQTRALATQPCEFDDDPPCHGCSTCFARETVRLLDAAPAVRTLREQVAEFHKAMDMPADAERPTIILDDRVRLRAALIAEECVETMAAMFSLDVGSEHQLRAPFQDMIERARVRVDMVELADGLADLDYVIEGTRLEFGIDGAPIAAEVHRANMAKAGGPVAPNGKRLKPPGWTPPDVAGELRKQGWRP